VNALSPIARASVKDQALDQLKRFIASGAIDAGGRLPSERELARQLGVGRNSVREAMKILEALGIVESRIGEGTFIVEATGASIGRTIGFALATWGGALVELLQARQMIEPEAARFAARHATADDLAAILAEVERMAEADDDAYGYLAADMRFHRLVAAATHNGVVAALVANLIDAVEEVLRELRADQIAAVAEGTATHRDIFAALAARDVEAASRGMRDHLQFSTDLWTAVASLTARAGPDHA
jgi:GntR family transcriptional repressor for pyruvate dehydrogenase complex